MPFVITLMNAKQLISGMFNKLSKRLERCLFVHNSISVDCFTSLNLYHKSSIMASQAAIHFPPKLVYVDHRGIESYRYSPGALTVKQFDEYLNLRQMGISRETAHQRASETPKR